MSESATPAPTPKQSESNIVGEDSVAEIVADFDLYITRQNLRFGKKNDEKNDIEVDCCELLHSANALFVCSYRKDVGANLHLFRLNGLNEPSHAWSLEIPKDENENQISTTSNETSRGGTSTRATCVTAGPNFVAIGLIDGRVVLLQLPPNKSKKFVIAARHDAAVNCLARAGDVLFSADAFGQISRIHVPHVFATSSSFTPMIKSKEQQSILSMEVDDDLLVCSLATRHIIVKGAVSCTMTEEMVPQNLPNDARNAFDCVEGTPPLDIRWLGSKPHSGIFTASLATRSPGALVARPKGRMWIANAAEGAVQSTIRFSSALPGRLRVVGDTSVLAWAKTSEVSEGAPSGVFLCDLASISTLQLLNEENSHTGVSFVAFDSITRMLAILGKDEVGVCINFVVLRDSPREILSVLMENKMYTTDLQKCLELVVECIPFPQVQPHSYSIQTHPEAGRCNQTLNFLQPLIDGVSSVDVEISDDSAIKDTLIQFRKLIVALEDASGGQTEGLAFPKLNSLHKPLGQFPRVAGIDADTNLVDEAMHEIDENKLGKVVKRDVMSFPPVRTLPNIKSEDVLAVDVESSVPPSPVKSKNAGNAFQFSHTPAGTPMEHSEADETGPDSDTDSFTMRSTASSSNKPIGKRNFINPSFVRSARQTANKRKRKLQMAKEITGASNIEMEPTSPGMKLSTSNSKTGIGGSTTLSAHSLVVSDFVDLFSTPSNQTKTDFVKKAKWLLSLKNTEDKDKTFNAAFLVCETACRYVASHTYWPYVSCNEINLFDENFVDSISQSILSMSPSLSKSNISTGEKNWKKALKSIVDSGHLSTTAQQVWGVTVMNEFLDEFLLPWPASHSNDLARLFVIVNGLGPNWTSINTRLRQAATGSGVLQTWLPKEVGKGANISTEHARHAAVKKLRSSSSPFFLHYVLPSLLGDSKWAQSSYEVTLAAFPAVLPWNLVVWSRIHNASDPLSDRRFVEYLRRLLPAVVRHTPKGFDSVVRDCASATMKCLLEPNLGFPVDAGERDGLADLLLSRHGKVFTKSELAEQKYLPGLLSAIRTESPKPRARSRSRSRSRSNSPDKQNQKLETVEESILLDLPPIIVSPDENQHSTANTLAEAIPPVLLRIPPPPVCAGNLNDPNEQRQNLLQAVPMVSNESASASPHNSNLNYIHGLDPLSPGGNSTLYTEDGLHQNRNLDDKMCYGVARFGGNFLMEASDVEAEDGEGINLSPKNRRFEDKYDEFDEYSIPQTPLNHRGEGQNFDRESKEIDHGTSASAFNTIKHMSNTWQRGISGVTVESERSMCNEELATAPDDLARTLKESCSVLDVEDAKQITISAYSYAASCLPTYPARNVNGWNRIKLNTQKEKDEVEHSLPIADWLRCLTETNRESAQLPTDKELASSIVDAFAKSRN